MYQRDQGQTCQTDNFGKMKYHYCEAKGTGKQVCKQEPAPQNPTCKTFFEKNKQNVPKDKEIMILHSTMKKNRERSYTPSFCFNKVNPENSQYGWCMVQGNYYDLYRPDEEATGWGYCSKDCYLDPNELPSKLRIVDNASVGGNHFHNLQGKIIKLFRSSPKNFVKNISNIRFALLTGK